MESKDSNKMKYVILAVLSILVFLLSAGLYLQGRQFSELEEEFDANNLAEKSQTEITAEISSSGKILSQNDEDTYKNRIKKLETQIADMREWKDYLKEAIDEQGIRPGSGAARNQTDFGPQAAQADKKSEEIKKSLMRRSFSTYFKEFFEENNYPQEIKEDLIDLYIERNNDLSIFGDTSEKEPGLQALKIYDEKLADLLSEEGLMALKEYEQTNMERDFIRGFKRMLGDENLEKEKEKKLIALMHSYRESALEERTNKLQPYYNTEVEPDEETMEMIKKFSLEWQNELYENYFSLAEGILSESQMLIYEGYVNMQKAYTYGR